MNGEYQFDDVPSGSYVVRCTPTTAGLAREFYDDATRDGLATAVEVFGGNSVTGIDAFLESGNTIQGTLVDVVSTGIPEVQVSVRALQDEDGKDLIFTTTDANGEFQLSGIPDGEYLLYFDPQGVSEGYIAEYYGGTPTPAGATVIDLSNEEAFTASRALDRGGLISGRRGHGRLPHPGPRRGLVQRALQRPERILRSRVHTGVLQRQGVAPHVDLGLGR